MVMMAVMTVMRCCGKRRPSKRYHQEHSSDELFHEVNVARRELLKRSRGSHESSEATIGSSRGKGVKYGE
jgi:hypothetical protein